MTSIKLDPEGRSTIAAAEAQAALARGNTDLAKEKYRQAGEFFEQDLLNLRKQPDKHLIRFLAATQYFQGGNYDKAKELCEKIDRSQLPGEYRRLLEPFRKQVKSRVSSRYSEDVRNALKEELLRKDYAKVIETLQEHPYVLPPAVMALLRARACEDSRQYRIAAAFHADAIRFEPDNPSHIINAVAEPLVLASRHELDSAWTFSEYLIEALTHPIASVVGSIVCFQKAAQAKVQEGLLRDHIAHFERALAEFDTMPRSFQAHADLRGLMILGFECATLSLSRLGDLFQAREYADRAIEFAPKAAGVWLVRGMIRYPDPESVEDFKTAITLGDTSYTPHYYLAHQALSQRNFAVVLDQSERALMHRTRPERSVAAQLCVWKAIAQLHLGADREEVMRLLQHAKELDSANPLIGSAYQSFLESERFLDEYQEFEWPIDGIQDRDNSIAIREAQFGKRSEFATQALL